MSVIYSSFDDLLEKNKSLFKYLVNSRKHRGILRACWDARQSEIDTLVEKNQLKTNDIAQSEGDLAFKSELIEKYEKKINSFNSELNSTKVEFNQAKGHIHKLKKYSEEVKNRNSKKDEEVDGLLKKIDLEKDSLHKACNKIDELEGYISTAKSEWEKSSTYVDKLNTFLKKSQDHASYSEQELIKTKKNFENSRRNEEKMKDDVIKTQGLAEDLTLKLEKLNVFLMKSNENEKKNNKSLIETRAKLKLIESEKCNLELLNEKLNANVAQLEANVSQLNEKYEKVKEKEEQQYTYNTELKTYTEELRANGRTLKNNLEKSFKNEYALRDYSGKIKNLLEREKIEHKKAMINSNNKEVTIQKIKSENETLKAELTKFKKVLNNIENSLGPNKNEIKNPNLKSRKKMSYAEFN